MQDFQDNLIGQVSGILQPIAGAQVTVKDNRTGLPAALYSDNGHTALDQPLATNDQGLFSFYAANGSYTLSFSGKNIQPFSRVAQLYDPADDAPFTQQQAAAPSGASKIGIGAETVENALNALQLADYAALRAYAGPRKNVYIVASGIAGMFVRDDADTASVDDNATCIVASSGARFKRPGSKFEANILWFGADRTGTNDSTAALAAARAWLATTRGRLIFPQGAYLYSQSPNWAIHHAQVAFEGDVRLRYAGTGDAVVIDASAVDAVVSIAGLLYGLAFGWGNKPIIESPSTAGNGMYVRSAHHCKIGARVRGCGTSSSGLKVQFAVCSEFDIAVSVNEEAWYSGGKPAIGINLDKRNAGETTSYCTFVNPVIEGPGIGIQLTATLGNTFVGGASEGCSQYGLFASSAAAQDKIIGMDFESNTSADIYDLGNSLLFQGCDTMGQITLQSKNAKVVGGRHKKILVDSTATYATVRDVVYNRFNDGTTFTDAGAGTVLHNVRNGGSNALFLTGTLAFAGATIGNNASGAMTITVAGANFGDYVRVAFPWSTQGLFVTASVTAVNTVTVYLYNNTGASVTLASGTVKAQTIRE